MKTLWPSITPGFPLSGFILQDKSSQLYPNGKNQFVCLFSSFAICLTQQMPTCHTSRGEGFSDIQSHCWRRRIGVLSLQRNHNKHFWHLLIFMSILLLLLLLFYYLKQLGEEGLKEKVEYLCSVQFSHSVVSDSMRPHESQHARPPRLSTTPGVYSNSCQSSWWCHPGISSSVIPFSFCPQSFPA